MSCDDCPKCDTCGAPITTGLMAVFCPRQDCEFMPPEGLPPEFQAWRDQVLYRLEQARVNAQTPLENYIGSLGADQP